MASRRLPDRSAAAQRPPSGDRRYERHARCRDPVAARAGRCPAGPARARDDPPAPRRAHGRAPCRGRPARQRAVAARHGGGEPAVAAGGRAVAWSRRGARGRRVLAGHQRHLAARRQPGPGPTRRARGALGRRPVVTLVVAHELWEHGGDGLRREQAVLFNAATTITVVLGVLVLYAAPFAFALGGAWLVLANGPLAKTLGHPPNPSDYLRLAWLRSSLVGGRRGRGGGGAGR